MVRYIGMDVHREFAQLAVLEDGLVRDEGRIGVTPEALRAWADGLRGDDQVALGATGNSDAIANLVAPLVGRVVVSTPSKTRANAEAKVNQKARPMSDGIDPTNDNVERGPWPPVNDLSRLFVHGWPRCVDAVAHPDPDGGYLDPQCHVPWHECRSRAAFVDDVRLDLDGEPVGVSVYKAAPFRFGQPRDEAPSATPRVVLEVWTNDDAPAQRISFAPGEALRLARIFERYAEELTFVQRTA